MLDTYADIWGRVLLRCDCGSELAKDWVRNAFRQVAERRRWSWLYKFGQFILPQLYNTGTVSVTQNSIVVTGSGTNWTGDMMGRQFRIGITAPIYTIAQVNSPTSLSLDTPWGGVSSSTQGYSIYLAYVTVPDDFHAFVSVWDPNYNWRLWLNFENREIDLWDAQRSNTSIPYTVTFRDFTKGANGTAAQPVRVIGSGSSPATNSNPYTAPNNALFTVQITTGGAAGTAVYQWSKDGGTFTTNVLTDAGGGAQDLQDGVQIYFPVGPTYTLNDVFIIRATANSAPGLPRYELWPHQQSAYVYPFLYESRAADLSDPGAVLPRYIRGDVLLEGALAEAARWPGPKDKPNAYYDLNLWKSHNAKFETMVMELERQDDNQNETDLQYAYAASLPYAPLPFGDSNWLQRHAI